jgi:hypothetical protein
MTPTEVTMLLISLMMLAASLSLYAPGPCVCDECATHVKERTEKAEVKRLKDHRDAHRVYKYDWGDPNCMRCRDGGDRRDRP